MIKKHAFFYEGKTGIAATKGFQKKGLAELSCNIGNTCEYGCTFCYVPALANKQKSFQNVMKQGLKVDEFSLYRTRENVLQCVKASLRRIKPDDTRTVFFCTTCDPCPNREHMKTTFEAIKLIMNISSLNVRVLSKSSLITELAFNLPEWRDRVIYGLSTGTSRPEISEAVEGNASPISERVAALRTLQDNGYRTFGMICPVLPGEMAGVDDLIAQIRPEKCEHVWAEAINLRGESLSKTRVALTGAGLLDDASMLDEVMSDKVSWRDYATMLFTAFKEEMDSRGLLPKLRYLQYVTREPDSFKAFFSNQIGAVCL